MKRYLKTPEAVIKALKSGKEVRDENNYSFKIVDGFIVATYDDDFYIGYTIAGLDKPYILEEEPLKIEVGKWYETRDHQKARCYYAGEETAFFSIDNNSIPLGVYLNGRLYKDMETPLDIIGHWEE